MNISDSERIAGFLEARKLKPSGDIKKANLVIFNTCGVRQMAEDRVYGQIHNLHKINPKIKIVLTGCLSDRKDVQRRLENKVDLFVSINDFFKIISLRKIPRSGKNWPKLKSSCAYLNIAPKYSDKQSAFIPIMTGCNNFCSYCVVPYARGKEVFRPFNEITKEIKNLSKNGCKEITLLGQNVNSYHGAKKQKFPKLLNDLAKSFPKITFKFLTSHPKDFSEELMGVIATNKNISREIHLPIQSGSDKILKLMNRPYTQKHYLNLIKKARKTIPDATFTTDIIVGFPGETEKDFKETVKVIKKVGFSLAYINKYSPRPDTAAEKLSDPISWEEKKRREKILRKIIK
jgi:tRNA-2-methylthio-N6-dimethylallyladenosine synthase